MPGPANAKHLYYPISENLHSVAAVIVSGAQKRYRNGTFIDRFNSVHWVPENQMITTKYTTS